MVVSQVNTQELLEHALQFVCPKGSAEIATMNPKDKELHDALMQVINDMNEEPEPTAHVAIARMAKVEGKDAFAASMMGFLAGLAVTNLVLREPTRTRELLRVFEQGARAVADSRRVRTNARPDDRSVVVPGNETIN